MANYWSEFSIAFKLPSKEAMDYSVRLHKKLTDMVEKRINTGEVDPDFSNEFSEDYTNDFECEVHDEESFSLWIWQANGESSGVDDAINFIQHLLKKFDHKSAVTIGWSNCCGKPRLDAFGGGAAIIMAEEVKWFNTSQWIDEQLKAITKEVRNES